MIAEYVDAASAELEAEKLELAGGTISSNTATTGNDTEWSVGSARRV